ncbi:MAG: ABC transporter permease [Ilumatobacteraceae bacterium]
MLDQPVDPDLVAAAVDDTITATAVERAPSRRLGVLGWGSIGWLAALTVTAALADVLPLDDPERTFRGLVGRGPGTSGHLLGGDGNGRDLFARVVFGARSSLLLAVGAVSVGLIIGGTAGLIAGYVRGRVDAVVTVLLDAMLAFPALVLALTLVTTLAGDPDTTYLRRLGVLILALGIVSIPIVARVARVNTLTWSQREFITAARAAGATHRRIVGREILPNVLPAMFSATLLGIAILIVAEGGLSILGVGIKNSPSLGNIIAVGRDDLRSAPHIVFAPVAVIFLTVLALNLLGDIVRARVDVRDNAL